MSAANETVLELTPAPSDGVTRVQFSKNGSSVLLVGWSGELALHSSTHGTLTASTASPCALLDAAWGDDVVYVAALDGDVYSSRLTPSGLLPFEPLSTPYASAASCVAVLKENLVVSASWDGCLRVTDARVSRSDSTEIMVNADGKVFGLTVVDENSVAFITSQKRVRVSDVRKPTEFLHDIAPSFGAPLRCIDASPVRPVLVLGSTDGRVAVESMDTNVSPGFAFKCHRQDGRAYPVNTIRHNKKYGSFASGGGDGHVSVWDGAARKRIYQYPCAPTSIASLDFSPDDSIMVVAVSYTFEEGERDHAKDSVYIRNVNDAEIRTRDADSGIPSTRNEMSSSRAGIAPETNTQ